MHAFESILVPCPLVAFPCFFVPTNSSLYMPPSQPGRLVVWSFSTHGVRRSSHRRLIFHSWLIFVHFHRRACRWPRQDHVASDAFSRHPPSFEHASLGHSVTRHDSPTLATCPHLRCRSGPSAPQSNSLGRSVSQSSPLYCRWYCLRYCSTFSIELCFHTKQRKACMDRPLILIQFNDASVVRGTALYSATVCQIETISLS